MENYTKSRVIGKGSYGEVWLAKHKRDKKQYVLKKIDLKRSSTKERKAAEQEAKLLHKLRHPNIVAYKDSFEADDGYLYIAMGYCEGGDLYNKLKEQKGTPLEERQVVEWFVQIAMALQYMHERNILHRDLKTQNIFLTKSKIIKVGDLGIARVLDSSNDMATTLIGTPYYMSPELFSNKPYNHKSDVWALGCCVYEMATLKHAFNAKDMNSLVYKILRGRMPAMPKFYSPELTALIRSMLSQNPDKRPSVNRILRDPYIKKNIAIFLEGTKKRRPSVDSRPSTASSSRHSSVSDTPEVPESSRPNVAGGAKVYDNRRPALRQNQEKVEPLDIGQELSAIKEEGSPAGNIFNKPQQRRHQGSGDSRISNASRSPTPEKSKLPAGGSPSRPPARKKKNRFLKPKAPPPIEIDVEDSPLDKHDNHNDHSKPEENHVNEDDKPMDVVDSETPLHEPRSRAPKASESVPQKSKSKLLKPSSASSSGSSMASSKENREEKAPVEELPAETPRSSINSSARARRRERKESETPRDSRNVVIDKSRRHSESHDGPVMSARKQASRKALGVDEPDAPLQRPRSAGNPRGYSDPSARGRGDFDRERKARVQKQPSVGGESSSSSTDSGDVEENPVFQKDREKRRKNKEMDNFISALDTTLKMNKPKEKSESEDSEENDDDDIVTATPRPLPPRPQLNAVPEDEQLHVDPSTRHRRNISEPPKRQPAGTLGASTRLMDRIAILRKDCIRGLGVEKLKRAYDILDNIEGDELEPLLVSLLGRTDYDLYAGKIWQLKFCEDNLFARMT